LPLAGDAVLLKDELGVAESNDIIRSLTGSSKIVVSIHVEVKR